MRKIFSLVVASLLAFAVSLHAQENNGTLEVYITDFDSQQPVAGATVHVGRRGFRADVNGHAAFRSDVKGDSLVVTCLGYRRRAISMSKVRETQPFRLELTTRDHALEEAVVSAHSVTVPKTTVAETLDEGQLRQNLGKTFASSLENIKGVSMVESGTSVAKPVIHGMYGHRILIVNNGVRQQGQQWGDDHAPELDVNTAGHIDVIKGADAVRYGSDALGGIVQLDPRTLPFGAKRVQGSLSSLYGSNGHRYALTGYAEGALLKEKNLAWRVQGTYVNSGDRRTAHYLLNNTGMREDAFSAAMGYRAGRWDVDAFYSYFHTKLAVMYTAHAGNVDLLRQRIAIGRPLETTPFTRHIDYPYQDVSHHIARVKAGYRLNERNQFSLQAAYQSDHRDEFHLRRNNLSHVPSLALDLTATQIDAGWKNFSRAWTTEAGVFYGNTKNTNMPGTGVVPVIPNYTQNSLGAFAIERYTAERWGAEIGLRYDYQQTKANGIDLYGTPYGGTRTFNNLVYNAGAHYQLTDAFRIVSNIGVAWRAPHVYELYSNGLDHGSGVFAKGDSTMQSERSTKWITSLTYRTKKMSLSVDGYLQWVKNYLYDEPTGEFMTVISGAYPVFAYRSVPAFFRGIDAQISWEPLAGLSYDAMASMIWVNERHTGRYLPFIPPFRFTHSITLATAGERRFLGMRNAFVKLRHKFVAKQNRFDAASDLTNESPAAYHLLGLELGSVLELRHVGRLNFLLAVDNLLNKEYKEYTNRFRYYSHEMGRDIRVMVTLDF